MRFNAVLVVAQLYECRTVSILRPRSAIRLLIAAVWGLLSLCEGANAQSVPTYECDADMPLSFCLRSWIVEYQGQIDGPTPGTAPRLNGSLGRPLARALGREFPSRRPPEAYDSVSGRMALGALHTVYFAAWQPICLDPRQHHRECDALDSVAAAALQLEGPFPQTDQSIVRRFRSTSGLLTLQRERMTLDIGADHPVVVLDNDSSNAPSSRDILLPALVHYRRSDRSRWWTTYLTDADRPLPHTTVGRRWRVAALSSLTACAASSVGSIVAYDQFKKQAHTNDARQWARVNQAMWGAASVSCFGLGVSAVGVVAHQYRWRK